MARHAAVFLAAVMAVACGDDGDDPTEPRLDGAVPDAGDDLDATKPDSGSDAGVCGIDQRYVFATSGGDLLFHYRYEVVSDNLVIAQRIEPGGLPDGGVKVNTCGDSLLQCGSASFGVKDISDVLRSSAVRDAFTTEERVLGRDDRPVDGTVLVVAREDGKQITLGSRCTEELPGLTCIPYPPALDALRDLHVSLGRKLGIVPSDTGVRNGECRLLGSD